MTSFNDDSYPEWAQASSLTREYYEFEWGRRLTEEHELYELIALLGFQAGLNWSMVLNKRERLREVFHNFDPDAVAQFDHDDIEGMLHDKTLIRNRRKLSAAVHNAKAEIPPCSRNITMALALCTAALSFLLLRIRVLSCSMPSMSSWSNCATASGSKLWNTSRNRSRLFKTIDQFNPA